MCQILANTSEISRRHINYNKSKDIFPIKKNYTFDYNWKLRWKFSNLQSMMQAKAAKIKRKNLEQLQNNIDTNMIISWKHTIIKYSHICCTLNNSIMHSHLLWFWCCFPSPSSCVTCRPCPSMFLTFIVSIVKAKTYSGLWKVQILELYTVTVLNIIYLCFHLNNLALFCYANE